MKQGLFWQLEITTGNPENIKFRIIYFYISRNHFLLPFRFIIDVFGATVDFDGAPTIVAPGVVDVVLEPVHLVLLVLGLLGQDADVANLSGAGMGERALH